MQAVWRLAINALAGRRFRASLLVAAVACSAALIVAITCGVASVNATLRGRIAATVGVADVRIAPLGEGSIDDAVLIRARESPAVARALPRALGPITLTNRDIEIVANAEGVDFDSEFAARPLDLLAGRAPGAPDEIAVEERIAADLGITVGDPVRPFSYFGGPDAMTVTGVIAKPPFAELLRPRAVLDRAAFGEILGEPGALRVIDIILKPGADPADFADQFGADLPAGLVVQPTERITSGIDRNIRAQQIGLVVVSIIGFLAAALIILTGLATDVAQRQRELAIVRSVGGSKSQVAGAQLTIGAIIGGVGASLGVPAGILIALAGVTLFREHLTAGLVIPRAGVSLAAFGALATGILGAAWPAILASRVSPLQAMASRAAPRSRRPVLISLAAGITLILAALALMATADTPDRAFWTYILGGVQGMFIGYFLLGAPAVLLVARVIGPPIARLMRVPAALIAETFAVSPFRYGMTAASLMVGLAMMTTIWTAGGALVGQWLGAVDFPDAFVHGWFGLKPADREKIDRLPFVTRSNAVTIIDVDDAGVFGVTGLQDLSTSFVAFEPEPFFAMTRLAWLDGDPETAIPRLKAGGAVLVAKEFRVARGLGVGDTLTINIPERAGTTPVTFDIVGVITSPGLELAGKFFDIGRQFRSQAVSAVFGTRDDLIKHFGVETVTLVQVDLDDSLCDDEAVRQLRRAFAGSSVSVGSGREIKATVENIATGAFLVMSSVAVAAILIACLGVGNVIVAGIDARRFEFGVLRAVGAEGRLLGRLVLIEALVMSLAAGLLGTALGLQAAWSELTLYRRIAGLDLALEPPIRAIAIGWAIVLLLALATAFAPARRLSKRPPRELLAQPE